MGVRPPEWRSGAGPSTRLLAIVMAILAWTRPARADDGIVLMVQSGHVPGQVILSWSGPGSAFDVARDTAPAIAADAAHRLGTTAFSQWADQPPDSLIQYYTVRGSSLTRRPVDLLEPYVLLVVDSSGSLTSSTGAGPAGCPGAVDTRRDHIRCAVASAVADLGNAVIGLGRFRLTTTDADCSDGCTMTGTTCTGCDPATGAGCTPAMGNDARFELLTPLVRGGQPDLIRWNDFTCGTCGTSIEANPEFTAAGSGPIAGALKGARRYWQGLQALDGTILWPPGQGFDPIRTDPLRGAFLPEGPQCRPYLVVTVVDGSETCSTGADGGAAAAALLSTDVDGNPYRIESRFVGFGMVPGDAGIEALAHAGGAPDVPGAFEGAYPGRAGELADALTGLVRGAERPERCNGADDDCDGVADEAFPDLGAPCDDGAPGACRSTGTRVCRADGAGTECRITSPGAPPSPEVCNFLDDDCDGAVDEGCPGCAAAEVCGDGLDNDCDGVLDDGCASCLDWVAVGGGREIMRYEASRPDATPDAPGNLEGGVCARPGVQPWTDVTPEAAEAACASAGARLCTEMEWQRACAAVAPTSYPVTEPATGDGAIVLEAEDAFAATGAVGPDGVARAFLPDATTGFSGIAALQAGPDNGVSIALANAPAQSPRLDFPVTFTVSGNHHVWVRGFANDTASDAIHVGIGATATSAPTRTITLTASGTYLWVRTPAAINVTAGSRFVSLFMAEDGFRVDRIVVTRNPGTTPPGIAPASDGGAWSFATNPDAYVAGVCNGRDLDTDPAAPGDQDDLIATGTTPGGLCYASHGPGHEVFDLSGNVREWTAPRLPGVHPLRGGASSSTSTGIACAASSVAPDGFFSPNVGFRCCR